MVNIYNTNSNTLLSGTSGNDSIRNGGWWGSSVIPNGGSNVTIIGGAGNDYIHSYSSDANDTPSKKVIISGGNGDDNIDNRSDNSSINGGTGSDTIWNYGDKTTIISGNGNDSIKNYASNITIDGGKGDDSIDNGKHSDSSISGGAGNDFIKNSGWDITINGGKGNDTIYNEYDNYYGQNVLFKYNSGDGKDKIIGFNSTSTLQIGGGKGTYSTTQSGDNIIVTVGKGKITLVGGADLDILNIDGASNILNVTDSTKTPVKVAADIKFINASKRTKSIQITGNKLANMIYGGSKKDTLYGEGGNDSILGNAGNDKLYGGLGDDTLRGGKGNDTLIGGAGNDSLWGNVGADAFIYHAGEGDDVIFGFDSKDTLTLDSLDFTASHKSGVVTLKFEEGSITFKDFSATNFHINNDIYKISGSTLKKQ